MFEARRRRKRGSLPGSRLSGVLGSRELPVSEAGPAQWISLETGLSCQAKARAAAGLGGMREFPFTVPASLSKGPLQSAVKKPHPQSQIQTPKNNPDQRTGSSLTLSASLVMQQLHACLNFQTQACVVTSREMKLSFGQVNTLSQVEMKTHSSGRYQLHFR